MAARPTFPARVYCYQCGVEVYIMNSDFTCPQCGGGFVEELPSSTSSRNGYTDIINLAHRLVTFADRINTIIGQAHGPPPLPQEKMALIPKVQVTAKDIKRNDRCVICLQDYVLNETVCKLACLHTFHEHCIVQWFEIHATCPVCRKSLMNVEEGDELRNAN